MYFLFWDENSQNCDFEEKVTPFRQRARAVEMSFKKFVFRFKNKPS